MAKKQVVKPKELGVLIDELYAKDLELQGKLADAAIVDKEYDALAEQLQARLEESQQTAGAGSVARARIKESEHPSIEDMSKFWAYVKKNDAVDLFYKRITASAWTDRCKADGKRIPGTKVFVSKKLVVERIK